MLCAQFNLREGVVCIDLIITIPVQKAYTYIFNLIPIYSQTKASSIYYTKPLNRCSFLKDVDLTSLYSLHHIS
jgi:hypothetical protein